MYPFLFIAGSKLSKTSSPALSKYTSIPSGASYLSNFVNWLLNIIKVIT